MSMNTIALPSAELVETARRLSALREKKARHVRRGLLALARGHLVQARILREGGLLAHALEEIRLAAGLRKSVRLTGVAL